MMADKKDVFRYKWMNEGRVGKHLEKIGKSIPHVKSLFSEFQESEVYEIMKLALFDFIDMTTIKISDADHNKPGYVHYLNQLKAQLSFPSFVIGLVEDLKGFDEEKKKAKKQDIFNKHI